MSPTGWVVLSLPPLERVFGFLITDTNGHDISFLSRRGEFWRKRLGLVTLLYTLMPEPSAHEHTHPWAPQGPSLLRVTLSLEAIRYVAPPPHVHTSSPAGLQVDTRGLQATCTLHREGEVNQHPSSTQGTLGSLQVLPSPPDRRGRCLLGSHRPPFFFAKDLGE